MDDFKRYAIQSLINVHYPPVIGIDSMKKLMEDEARTIVRDYIAKIPASFNLVNLLFGGRTFKVTYGEFSVSNVAVVHDFWFFNQKPKQLQPTRRFCDLADYLSETLATEADLRWKLALLYDRMGPVDFVKSFHSVTDLADKLLAQLEADILDVKEDLRIVGLAGDEEEEVDSEVEADDDN